MSAIPPPRNDEAPGAATPRASMSHRSPKGKNTMHPINLQQKRNSAARSRSIDLTPHQAAVIHIGRLLVAYRVNGHPEQRAEIIGMAKMAAALGALDAATHAHLLDLISPDATPATACRPAALGVH